MLSVVNKPFILSAIILNVIMLSVVVLSVMAPQSSLTLISFLFISMRGGGEEKNFPARVQCIQLFYGRNFAMVSWSVCHCKSILP
jgi:hypothetical protein